MTWINIEITRKCFDLPYKIVIYLYDFDLLVKIGILSSADFTLWGINDFRFTL